MCTWNSPNSPLQRIRARTFLGLVAGAPPYAVEEAPVLALERPRVSACVAPADIQARPGDEVGFCPGIDRLAPHRRRSFGIGGLKMPAEREITTP